jgi:rhamnogalacturonan endolyase
VSAVESLEERSLMAFGLTTTTTLYTVDTGAGLVFSVQRTNPSGSVGDLTSAKLNGTELEAPFSTNSRYSHYESGLNSTTTVTATVDPNGQWILITCDDTTGTGVIQYYLGRKGFNNIYMATYSAGPNSPSPGEMRFIDYTNPTLLTNIPAPSNNNGNSGAIESSDVFGHPDGTTTSKYYGEYRAIDTQTYGMSGGGFGFWMNIGNRETSSGGPFYKDIDFQNNELYTYTFSGHSQTENFRPGLKGFYALMATTTSTPPAAPDYSFIDTLGVGPYVSGYVGASGRGTLSGVASGVPSGLQATVAISNAADQYWATPDPATGAYTMSGVLPGTYTETIYQGELAVGSVPVTINAGATTRQNITNTLSYIEESSSSTTVTTPVISNPIFRIGKWDGTPIGFLNADKIQNMHPTDVRMSPWAVASTGLTNFTVGVDPDSSWPMAEWHAQTAAAPFVDTDNRITFTLTASQASTALTLRVGLTRSDSARPNLSVNGHSTSVQSIASEPSSRGLTTGNWRGNNVVYIFNLSTSWMVAGTNTIDIFSVTGSTGTLYANYHIYDAIDLVPTSNLTNASHVASITVTPANPALNTSEQRLFTAVAKDQFGSMIPANFAWTSTTGTVDGTGSFIAPNSVGSGTVTATSGSVNGNTAVNIITPVQIIGNVFNYQTSQSLSLTFNHAVDPTMLAGAISIQNLTTQTTVPSGSISLNYSGVSGTFTFTGILANGNYQATIPAQTLLSSSGDHFTTAFTFNFFVQAGDANHDGKVDTADFTLLSQNFGTTTATFGQGDFNYDAKVNALDFNLLASNFGQTPGGSGAMALAKDAASPSISATGGPPPSLFSETSISTSGDELPDVVDSLLR